MPFRYAPLPNHTNTHERELEDSFEPDGDNSDSDDDQHDAQAESRPLDPSRSRSPPPTGSGSTYNFENLDYDYPPPGSPPRPSVLAIPNNQIGNSNGLIPQPSHTPPISQRSGWFRRAATAVLPNSVTSYSSSSLGPIGGGIENDGVFANINAKPSRGRIITDGDSGVHVVPEEAQKDAPPSYTSAQADAVPPYWETTIHAQSTFGGLGEMMVDGLPTGSFFSFLWNLLVSMSFQFVGFLLTFLLHSTHAAKLGSRAGLGITLIRYGFYLRTRADPYGGADVILDDDSDRGNWWPSATSPSAPRPTFGKASEAEDFYSKGSSSANFTSSPTSPFPVRPAISEGTAEWVSFLLMTVGWFILLTSTLSFWRVKRWERSIMASTPAEETPDEAPQAHNSLHTLERFGFPGAIWRNFRPSTLRRTDGPDDEEAILESGGVQVHVQPTSEEDLDAAARRARAVLIEARLQHDLRSAGLL